MAIAKPIIGERKMAKIVFVVPDDSTAPKPLWAMPAPSSPPISAWLDEEGMPLSQVITFQAMAPISAPNTTAGLTTSLSMIPLPTVPATWSPPIQEAAKLPAAPKITAINGERSCVETTVAIEFAASCSPLRKSNASARAISATSSGKASSCICPRSASGVVDREAVDMVRHVLEGVRNLLEVLEYLAGDDEADGVAGFARAREIGAQALRVDDVDLAFERDEAGRCPMQVRALAGDVAQQRQVAVHQLDRLDHLAGHRLHLGIEFGEFVKLDRRGA